MGRHRQSTDLLQLLPRGIHYTREMGVWLAVLRQAVVDIAAKRPGFHSRQARRWFDSPEFHPGSFLWVCDTLELNAVQLRTILEQNPKRLLEQLSLIKNGDLS